MMADEEANSTESFEEKYSRILTERRAGNVDLAEEDPEQDDAEQDLDNNEENAEDVEDIEAESEDADDGDDDTEADDEPDEMEKIYTVKIGGEEVKVPLKEIIAGYMKDGDYRKKTAEVAETRRAIEAEKQRIADLQSKREDYIKAHELILELSGKPPVSQETLDRLLNENPAEYIRAKEANDRWSHNVETVRQKIFAAKQEQREEISSSMKQRAIDEAKILVEKLPEMREEPYREAFVSYVKGFGFSDDEIRGTVDHRVFLAFDKARRYDELMQSAKPRTTTAPPKVTKGRAVGASQSEAASRQLVELKTKAEKSGSVEDYAAYLFAKRSKNRR